MMVTRLRLWYIFRRKPPRPTRPRANVPIAVMLKLDDIHPYCSSTKVIDNAGLSQVRTGRSALRSGTKGIEKKMMPAPGEARAYDGSFPRATSGFAVRMGAAQDLRKSAIVPRKLADQSVYGH